jgi:hypothetical protein
VPISVEVRAEIRKLYHASCGYCDVSEFEVGCTLEVDHFQPLSHGGTDDIANLVYACTACNRFKGDYWPTDDQSPDLHLLHPGKDDTSIHLVETASGRVNGLTKRGWFHIQWLRLNRPQLVALRQQRIERRQLLDDLMQAEATNLELTQRVRLLEREIRQLLALIRRLNQ